MSLPRAAIWPATALVLAVLPFLFPAPSALTILNQIAITAVFALSYNMLLGQAGMLSFGHAVYLGLGGFAAIHTLDRFGEWLWLPLLPLVGGAAALALAALVGSFQTRVSGTVFAMISLGIAELVAALALVFVAFFGGEAGISADRTVGPALFGVDFASQAEVYALTAAWALGAAGAMYAFSRTPLGRLANAVRDNAERVAFIGHSPHAVRWASFAAAGFFAGIAGALFAINYEVVGQSDLGLAVSGAVLLVAVLGGTGHFAGPILGAVVYTLLESVLSLHTNLWQLAIGVTFVVLVLFAPQGLAGLFARRR